ncbi:hypothetical protein A4R35_10080 [Thermogemmatispora tikiterensis]|uniref:Uncharacterized protein n=1 Tax=Thermogemmatispora tikiterensis TaxID=1825093 RepID=A0A328VLA1_9CHLR|nr:hypothetical protein A4R35_10080 [Thermogemmatispora tikiterensis]
MLTFRDIVQYQQNVAALAETLQLMEKIEDVIEKHGGLTTLLVAGLEGRSLVQWRTRRLPKRQKTQLP